MAIQTKTENEITYKESTGANWVLIYSNETTTADLIESNGANVASIYNIEEFSDEQSAENRITQLGRTKS